MQNEELDSLISAFLSGELDAAGREQLAFMLDADPAAREAFDEALRMEALLRAAHADAGKQIIASEKITRRLLKHPASRHATGSNVRPAPDSQPAPRASGSGIRKPNLFAQTHRIGKPASARAWIAVAAMIAVMFGLALYYKFSGPAKTNEVANPDSKSAFSVAAGRVSVDGREVKEVAENDWISVVSDTAATLQGTDGTTVKLEPGSSALLRARGANLFNGSGAFTVKTGKDLYVLETPAGTLNTQGGDFQIRLHPAWNSSDATGASGALALAVTVRSGGAQIDANGQTSRLAAGESRSFGDEPEPQPDPQNERPMRPLKPPRLETPEFAGFLLEHGMELGLSFEQRERLRGILKKVAQHRIIFEQDAQLKEWYKTQRNPEALHDQAFHELDRKIHERQRELTHNDAPGNPVSVLTGEQPRILGEILRKNRVNGPRPHGDGPNGRPEPLPPPGRDPRPPPPRGQHPPGDEPPPPPPGDQRPPPLGERRPFPPPDKGRNRD